MGKSLREYMNWELFGVWSPILYRAVCVREVESNRSQWVERYLLIPYVPSARDL